MRRVCFLVFGFVVFAVLTLFLGGFFSRTLVEYNAPLKERSFFSYQENASSSQSFFFEDKDASVLLPAISVSAMLVADVDTGEIILGSREHDSLPIASLTKFMTAVLASEFVDFEKLIVITPSMLMDSVQSFPLEAGANYRMLDLLYPALKESSNGAARALAGFLGEEYFVRQMNERAKMLGMDSTVFVDPVGVGEGNTSSLTDLRVMAKHILDKRKFLFDISRKERGTLEKNIFSDIPNYNEFYDDPAIIGVKNGETRAAGQTFLGVWEMEDSSGAKRNIMISLLGSKDRKSDALVLRGWLKERFGVE